MRKNYKHNQILNVICCNDGMTSTDMANAVRTVVKRKQASQRWSIEIAKD
ncbi:MAG: hypothetical protein MJB12_15550 [Firmicutes bacterium]|nr:hypothetical protein [Bacillota bacterium]